MKILVVDDESSIVNLIKMNLLLEGFEVETSYNGKDAIRKFKEINPDLVLLDIMLPDMEGYEVMKEMQSIDKNKPIILLTAKGQLNDKLLGLQLGADDYITKPFDSRELILRIRVILRRINKAKIENSEFDDTVEKGFLKIIKSERKVFVDGKEVNVTYKEFDTLFLMFKNCNKVFTREDLLSKVWGYDFQGNTRAVDILIKRLRKKLIGHEKAIKTIYGVGYKLEVS